MLLLDFSGRISMSDRLQTLGLSESRGVCGAAVLARAIGGDALSRLQQVLVDIGLPQAEVVASVQRGIKVSREAGTSALRSFFGDLEALGRALAVDTALLQLIEDWRLALSQRSSLSEERLALGYLCRFMKVSATAGSPGVAVRRVKAVVPPEAPAAIAAGMPSGPEDLLHDQREAQSELARTEPASVDHAMVIPVAETTGDQHASVSELNRRFAVDLAAHAGGDFVLDFPA
jgi:hypothetical protein